jgi:hypothetical protein
MTTWAWPLLVVAPSARLFDGHEAFRADVLWSLLWAAALLLAGFGLSRLVNSSLPPFERHHTSECRGCGQTVRTRERARFCSFCGRRLQNAA